MHRPAHKKSVVFTSPTSYERRSKWFRVGDLQPLTTDQSIPQLERNPFPKQITRPVRRHTSSLSFIPNIPRTESPLLLFKISSRPQIIIGERKHKNESCGPKMPTVSILPSARTNLKLNPNFRITYKTTVRVGNEEVS